MVDTPEKADVLLRWIKEYSDHKLGYAFNGGLVEIGFGDSECDGEWHSYDEFTQDRVLIHELGHILGKEHSEDSGDIMYKELRKTYLYEVSDLHQEDGSGSLSGKLRGTCSYILEAKRQGALVN